MWCARKKNWIDLKAPGKQTHSSLRQTSISVSNVMYCIHGFYVAF